METEKDGGTLCHFSAHSFLNAHSSRCAEHNERGVRGKHWSLRYQREVSQTAVKRYSLGFMHACCCSSLGLKGVPR